MIRKIKLTFWADLHLGALHEIACELPTKRNPFYFLLGDIYDLQNCPYKLVNYYKMQINRLKVIFGHQYMLDNHELRQAKCLQWFLLYNVFIITGSQISWSEERLEKYYKKHKAGAGFLKRYALLMAEKLKFLRKDKLSEEELEKCYELCIKWGADTLIMAHKHPKETIDVMYKGKRIVCLKRGQTELEVEIDDSRNKTLTENFYMVG